MSIKLVSSPIQINMKADRNYFEAKIKQQKAIHYKFSKISWH